MTLKSWRSCWAEEWRSCCDIELIRRLKTLVENFPDNKKMREAIKNILIDFSLYGGRFKNVSGRVVEMNRKKVIREAQKTLEELKHFFKDSNRHLHVKENHNSIIQSARFSSFIPVLGLFSLITGLISVTSGSVGGVNPAIWQDMFFGVLGLATVGSTAQFNPFNKKSFSFDVKRNAIFTDAESVGSRRQVNQRFSPKQRVGKGGVVYNLFAYPFLNMQRKILEVFFGLRSKFNRIHKGYLSPRSFRTLANDTQPFWLASSIAPFSEWTNSESTGRRASIWSMSQPAGFASFEEYSLSDNLSTRASSITDRTSKNAEVSNINNCGRLSLSTTTAEREPFSSLIVDGGKHLLQPSNLLPLSFLTANRDLLLAILTSLLFFKPAENISHYSDKVKSGEKKGIAGASAGDVSAEKIKKAKKKRRGWIYDTRFTKKQKAFIWREFIEKVRFRKLIDFIMFYERAMGGEKFFYIPLLKKPTRAEYRNLHKRLREIIDDLMSYEKDYGSIDRILENLLEYIKYNTRRALNKIRQTSTKNTDREPSWVIDNQLVEHATVLAIKSGSHLTKEGITQFLKNEFKGADKSKLSFQKSFLKKFTLSAYLLIFLIPLIGIASAASTLGESVNPVISVPRISNELSDEEMEALLKIRNPKATSHSGTLAKMELNGFIDISEEEVFKRFPKLKHFIIHGSSAPLCPYNRYGWEAIRKFVQEEFAQIKEIKWLNEYNLRKHCKKHYGEIFGRDNKNYEDDTKDSKEL